MKNYTNPSTEEILLLLSETAGHHWCDNDHVVRFAYELLTRDRLKSTTNGVWCCDCMRMLTPNSDGWLVHDDRPHEGVPSGPEMAIYGCGGDPIDDDRADQIKP